MKTYEFSKRLFDIVVSSFILILCLPLFLIISILIKLDSKGPVFFIQKRIGKNFSEFNIYKFRSMVVDAENQLDKIMYMNERKYNGFKIKNDPRVTKIGKFLRKYSIDELPQFLNVLKGDMSIVGPRPALPIEVEKYTSKEQKRLSVKQGITCLWQIYERNNPDFRMQVKLDIEYIKKRSFLFDLKLILLTIPSILKWKSY